MRSFGPLGAAAFAFPLGVGLLHLQEVPVRQLVPKPLTAASSFALIGDLYELPDGRVLVLDHQGLTVHLVDFPRERVDLVGRNGAGPGEYRLPERLVGLPGDSVGIWDAANSRMLVVGPGGAPAGVRDLSGRRVGTSNPGQATPAVRTSDLLGGFYGLGRLVGGERVGRPSGSEWYPVLRWSAQSQSSDTVAFLPLVVLPGAQRTGSGFITPLAAILPFAAGPVWAVGPDGTVAIVHPEPYRVEMTRRDGSRTTGPVIPYERVKVSDGHRRAYLEEWERPVPTVVYRRAEASTEIVVQSRKGLGSPSRWPSNLPPFLSGAARFTPDGVLWVERTVPADRPAVYDVFDASGRVRYKVELPAVGARLVGFGAGYAYLARPNPDGTERLERWGRP